MTERFHFHFSLSCTGEGNGNPLQSLAWRIPGTGEPGWLPSVGSHRVRHDWSDLAAAAADIRLSQPAWHLLNIIITACHKLFIGPWSAMIFHWSCSISLNEMSSSYCLTMSLIISYTFLSLFGTKQDSAATLLQVQRLFFALVVGKLKSLRPSWVTKDHAQAVCDQDNRVTDSESDAHPWIIL